MPTIPITVKRYGPAPAADAVHTFRNRAGKRTADACGERSLTWLRMPIPIQELQSTIASRIRAVPAGFRSGVRVFRLPLSLLCTHWQGMLPAQWTDPFPTPTQVPYTM